MSTRTRRSTASRSNEAATTDGDHQTSQLQAGNGSTSKKGQGGTMQSGERERVTYIAKEPTPDHTFIQPSGCANLVNQKIAAIERCRGCYEKKKGASGCTFVGIRVFRVENGKNDEMSKGEEVTQDTGAAISDTAEVHGNSLENAAISATPEQKKRKAVDNVSSPSPSKKLQKIKKGNSRVDYDGVIWDDYSFLGNLSAQNTNSTDTSNKIKTEECDATVAKQINDSQHSKSEKQDASYILSKIAPSYLRVLRRENKHEKQLGRITDGSKNGFKHPIVRMKSDPGQRFLCDACAASLFLVNYFCCVCGKEYCPDCYDEWDAEVECPRLDLCTRKRRHGKEQMMLMVRAAEGDIESMLGPVQKWVDDHPACLITSSEELQTVSESKFTIDSSHDGGFLSTPNAQVDRLDEEAFRGLWSAGGRPLVLSGCLPHFKMQWSPTFFQERYGDEKCYLHDCSDITGLYDSTVKEFFDGFERAVFQGKHLSLKLKDWPPSDDFAVTFPELFADFEGALPWEGRYMKRDGYMNVASRLPDDWNKPDLGPKMYNAYPAPGEGLSVQEVDLKDENVILGSGALGGTTNLHLDITDAVNFMMYASGPVPRVKLNDSEQIPDAPKSSKCSAVWDIFPPPAALKIRQYLSAKNPLIDDPIHRQTFFLSDEDLSNLREEPYNVRSYRISQNPGDAVFIPAGCPHQVRNVRSCIKVAVDFLSPENVHVCEGLLQEGRNLAKSGRGGLPIEGTARITTVNEGKREDVLQLWNCLKFAWESLHDIANSSDPAILSTEGSTDYTHNGGTGHTTNQKDGEKETMTVRGVSDVEQSTETKDQG